MAKIVAAYGLPHTPFFPSKAEEEGPESPTGLMFAKARESLIAAKPDVILLFDTDHYNTFFFDNFPILAIGIEDKFTGPNDEPRGGMPSYTVPSAPKLADYLHQHLVRADYDVASLRDFSCDHSVMVPLHFVNPGMKVPVIPFFISGHVPPLPSAKRCFALGQEIRKALEAFSEDLRVVIIGTGSFSLEVFGPRIDPGKTDGVPDPEWVHELCRDIEAGDTETIIGKASEDRMQAAGNVGGELLNWIAMFAFTDNRKPDFLFKQMENGHAYAGWRWG
ncbi:MAG: extradiol ring-cleavage dioxygenase [Pseudolabrys sp.]|nr:extradiol ring-cleavage dioxygenase [Pseudolabrys sp.]